MSAHELANPSDEVARLGHDDIGSHDIRDLVIHELLLIVRLGRAGSGWLIERSLKEHPEASRAIDCG